MEELEPEPKKQRLQCSKNFNNNVEKGGPDNSSSTAIINTKMREIIIHRKNSNNIDEYYSLHINNSNDIKKYIDHINRKNGTDIKLKNAGDFEESETTISSNAYDTLTSSTNKIIKTSIIPMNHNVDGQLKTLLISSLKPTITPGFLLLPGQSGDKKQRISQETENAQESTKIVDCEGEKPQFQVSLEESNIATDVIEQNNSTLKKPGTYLCSYNEHFDNILELANHQSKNPKCIVKITPTVDDKSIETYECDCEDMSQQEYKDHQKVHKPDLEKDVTKHTLVSCRCSCGKEFKSYENFRIHSHANKITKLNSTKASITKSPRNIVRILCKFCDKTFKTKDYYKRHLKIHTGVKNYECDVCDKKFAMKSSMISHKFTHTNPISCSHCDLLFRSKDIFNNHKVNGICPRKSKEELIDTFKLKILNVQKVTGYICKLCKKSFANEELLDSHFTTSHFTDSSDLLCFGCSERVSSKTELKAHISSHKKYNLKKTYQCNFCGKLYENQGSFLQHQRYHLDYRPNACPLCPKKFRTKAHLKHHMCVHTKERNFVCSYCSKTFTLNTNLLTHMRIHTGEKPYVCLLCQDSHRDSKALKKHVLGLHPECGIPWNQFLKDSYTRSRALAFDNSVT